MRFILLFLVIVGAQACSQADNNSGKKTAKMEKEVVPNKSVETTVVDAVSEEKDSLSEVPRQSISLQAAEPNPVKQESKATTEPKKEPSKSKLAESTQSVQPVAKVKKQQAAEKVDAVEMQVESVEEPISKTLAKPVEKAQEISKEVTEMVQKQSPWDAYDKFLQKYVSDKGFVRYKDMLNDQQPLNDFIKWASANPDYGSSRAEKMAYWINVYNANTIRLILNHYPVKSIMNLENGKVWKKDWIEMADATRSLDDIEHEILRKKYPDPRIHFAVNCAATSCPPLMNKTWRASNLEKDLEKQTKDFINNSNFNNLPAGKVSSIFDWYAVDFGDLKAFINKYAETPIPKSTDITFLEYNWELNGK